MMTSRTNSLRIPVACLISGTDRRPAGAASQCRTRRSDCHIAALEAFSSDPVSWTLWLHWINWLPGVVFGLLFALAALQWTPFYGRRAALYAFVSGLIYVAAGLVFSIFLDVSGADEFALIIWIWPAGFSAGLLGGLLLSLAANKLLRPIRFGCAGAFAGRRFPRRLGRSWVCSSC